MTEPRLPGETVAEPHDTSHPDGSRTLLGLPTSLPLVLDLDGTLIRGDLLYLSFFSILRRNPLIVLSCAAWLTRGRAALKRQLALRQRIDWSRIELQQDVVALAEREKAAGRRVVLATAADALLADQLASRLPWIDQVLASDGEHNLKGPNKADLLCKTFLEGFIYAGDSASDLAVWAHASGVITVNARESVRADAARLGRPMLHLPGRAAAAKS
ncbi:haloacid dehalogenase-like hydrolase [Bradyrhizobium tropiciagri]|uniref:haloacid dehalogenase-like hydrolase n=1 Tax=Bradyrhizobium tropiciagri TaxID=312253 RepID=UPI001BA705E1|nr:haloacid dehalogenase-like hydrolase [Bradyrhizobium tropiciagri]MBR0894879.1 haloacid dehalogenase-like hydrolase [Bradyrhizobium tropiciagri]